MNRILYKIVSPIVSIFERLFYSVKQQNNNKLLGGGKRSIEWPFVIKGTENIVTEEPISIGPGSTIYTTRAQLIIKKHFIAGPNLTIITGDHKYVPERWLDSIEENEKEGFYDQDVIIEEDVWCGANVTILKGVTIGRSSIVAAGSLVTKDVPPYSIVGGVPAKIIKRKWEDKDISRHNEFINNSL